MSAAKTTTISLIVVLAAAALLTAQTPAALSEKTVQGLEIAFAGFDGQNRPTYDVAINLAAHGSSSNNDSLIVRIRDDCNPPPYNPTVPEASWTYTGCSSKPVRVTVRLTLPLYYRGPIVLDSLMKKTQRMGLETGQMMLPKKGLGIMPYGVVDLESDCLHLHGAPSESISPALHFSVQGAPSAVPGFFVLSAARAQQPLLGGTLCVHPGCCIWQSPILKTDAKGYFETVFPVPKHPALIGRSFYFQAVTCGAVPSRPALFSNGVEVKIQSGG